VEDVFVVLDAYHVEHSILAAESAGAAIALGAALKHPARITGLVIVDGFYFRNTPEGQDPFLAGLKSHYAETLDGFVEACVPEKNCDHIKRWGRQILDRATPEAAIALYRIAGSVDLRPDLPRITQPTLVLHGEADRLVSLETARSLAATLPNAKLTILNGAGHVPTMTRPQEVARAINAFFDKPKP
jgi:pimeloyl-ACP methyl ester carboxylesterase